MQIRGAHMRKEVLPHVLAPRLATAYDACLIQRRGIGLLSAPDLESHSVGGALRNLLEEVLVYVENDRAARDGLVVLTTPVDGRSVALEEGGQRGVALLVESSGLQTAGTA